MGFIRRYNNIDLSRGYNSVDLLRKWEYRMELSEVKIKIK